MQPDSTGTLDRAADAAGRLVADGAFLGSTTEQWLQAAAAAAGGVALLWVLRRLTERRLAHLAEQTETVADDFAIELVRGIRPSLFVFVALVGIDAFIAFPSPANEAVRIVKILALVLQGFAWTNVIVAFWLGQWSRNNPQQSDRTTIAALGFGVRLALWVLLVLLALQNYGVNITTLITGLGVGGIAIALAVQNVLGDLFAALSIVLDKPFLVGDYVVVDQLEGTVEKVGLKTTRIRSLSGEQIVFSNADLLKSRIRNYAGIMGRRFLVQTTVTLGTDAGRLSVVPDIFRKAVEGQPYVTFQRSHLVGSTLAGHEFETAFVVVHPEYLVAMDARQAILLRVYSALEREGIVLAAPATALQPKRGTA
ncbi:MAG: mechanosensitive ion channel family protein [Gemmatimonadetes bacterium]|nr:mechanosensitive ion channel family protein [Gemmatimonadota bacterium]